VSERSVIGACALNCPDACSWVVTAVDGEPRTLRGNPDHPFTRGHLCVKVNPYLEYVKRPDRLLHPLRRVGAKGEGRFDRVSWDQALAEIAHRLHDVIETYGGEAIWPYAGTGTVGWIQGIVGGGKRLFHALGASRHDPTICSVAGHVGMSYTTGSAAGMDPEDLAHSRLVLLWGTNTLTSNQHLWHHVRAAQHNGAELIVVDPMLTKTAKRADRHIAPKPGTDAALALGVMAQLVQRRAHDEQFLAERTLGWGEFERSVLSAWSAGRAASVCGIGESEVIELADAIARSRPTGIRTLMGMQRHGGGGQAMRVLSCIPAVTGDYLRRGGGMCYSTSPAYPLNADALCRPDLQPEGPTRSLAMTRLGQGLLDLDDPPVKALVVWAANPVASNPDQRRVRRGLARADLFCVVVEHFLTDTTAYADIVLPGAMQIEQLDLHDSYTHLYLNLNRPVVEPPEECLPHTEIFRRIAAAMGLSEPALYASDEELIAAALDSPHPSMADISYERLQRDGWARIGWPRPYLPFADGFPTPSGRFEFASEHAAQEGVGRLPDYVPPYEAADADRHGLIALVAPANHHFVNATFNDSPLHERGQTPILTVNPADAEQFGVHDGERVRVENERGSFVATASVSSTVRRGVAVTVKGLPPARYGDAWVNATVAERDSDMGRGAVYHDNLVRLVPLAKEVAQ
jgi:anaerobic selenocysteine-containing dehydrogenase